MGELEEKLENILGNPQAMAQIMSLAQSLGGPGANAPEQAPAPSHEPGQPPEQPSAPAPAAQSEAAPAPSSAGEVI